MTARRCAACCVLLAACGDYFDPDGIVVTPPCDEEQRVDGLRPRPDDEGVYGDGWVWAELSCPAPTAVITVERLGGGPAQGLLTVHHSGRQVRFHPDPPLQLQSTFNAQLDARPGVMDWRFMTGALGHPIDEPLDERGLAFIPRWGETLDPPGVDDWLPAALAAWHPVMQFRGEPGDTAVAVRLGTRAAEDPASPQDMAQPTFDFPASWDDPYFRLGPFLLDHRLAGGGRLVVEDAVVEGAVSDEGWDSGGGGMSLAGRWDTRPLESALALPGGTLCDAALAAFSDPCDACDDGAAACLPFLLVHVPAGGWTSVLAPVP